MANTIEITGNNEFTVKARGMTLVCKPSIINAGEWDVVVDSAMVRAYRTMGMKTFATLEAVEKHYKSFRGLVDVAAAAVEVEAAPVVAEAPIAAPVASVSVVDTVKAIAKRHGVHCRQLRLKRGVMSLGRQTEWLSRDAFESLVEELRKVKGIRIQQLDTLRDSARHQIKEDRIMVDTINIELIN
ncbi:MAG: hypothetical protein ACRC2Y_04925 [Aeromonas veronii]